MDKTSKNKISKMITSKISNNEISNGSTSLMCSWITNLCLGHEPTEEEIAYGISVLLHETRQP